MFSDRLFFIRASLWLLLLKFCVAATICHDTSFKVNGLEYNVNHLKSHLPPSQKYSDKSNIFGFSISDKKTYLFFNLADTVYKQKIDDNHKITSNCFPRTQNADRLTNTPVACIPEEPKNCADSEEPCWIALGSCTNVSYKSIEKPGDGVQLLYTNGDFEDKKFVVSINCCKSGDCLSKTGLDSPVKFQTTPSECPQKADYCVEFDSPYGCDCDTRAEMDSNLNKKELACDATPSGLSSDLSTGSWLLIFFFTIVALYFGIGVGCNCFNGHRGNDVIPHEDMWKDLGGLIYDGFMFVKSCGLYREGFQYDSI